MSVEIKTNAANLNHKDGLLTCKSEVPLIVNTLNIYIFQEMCMTRMYLTFIMTSMLNYLTYGLIFCKK